MGITTFHGIGAYCGIRSPLQVRAALDTLMEGVEICTADRPIGQIGVVVSGDCVGHFKRDVRSSVADDGKRHAEVWYDDELPTPRSQAEYTANCQRALEEDGRAKHYTEAWISAYGVCAVWVKPWASPAVIRLAHLLAKNRGIPCIVLDGTTRIWEVENLLGFFNPALGAQKTPKFADIMRRAS